MIRAADQDSGTDRRRRLPCALAAIAIVVGLLTGALACAANSNSTDALSSGGHSPTAQRTAISGDSVHAHPAEHTDGHGTADQHHANMACLVDITLRIADLDAVIVSQPTAGSESCSVTSRFFGPEPPVPRTSS